MSSHEQDGDSPSIEQHSNNVVASRAAWLVSKRAEWQGQRDALRSRESLWTFLRLVLFLVAGVAWIPLRDDPPLAGAITVVGLIAFGFAVSRHRRVKRERESMDRLLVVADESRVRLGGAVAVIRSTKRPQEAAGLEVRLPTGLDSSSCFELSDQELIDLDVYGEPCGIFGLLNRTSSAVGARRLRDWLERPALCVDAIAARRGCVALLGAECGELRLRLMAGLAALRGQDEGVDRFLEAVARAKHLPNLRLVSLLRVWSIASLLLTVAACVLALMGHTQMILWWMVLATINGVLLHRFRRPVGQLFGQVKKTSPAVLGLCVAAMELSASSDEAFGLSDQNCIGKLTMLAGELSQSKVLPAIRQRIEWADTGGLMHTILNLAAFYDLHVADSLSRLMIAHRQTIFEGVGALADLDAVCSPATFSWEQPHTCYPEESDQTQLIIEGGLHPLIDPAHAVANDVSLGGSAKTWVVSGSNMAGKSTFLRMTATNLLLAQIGCAVCAKRMIYRPMRLMTDLRIRDDLSRGESYFLAEVRQIRRMLDSNGQDAPLLGLIDELFRGTNSSERVAASMALIRHLALCGNLFIVATHEQALIDNAESIGAVNRHFRESIGADGPAFDYRLREGPVTMRNAIEILAREGFPPDIVNEAKRIERG